MIADTKLGHFGTDRSHDTGEFVAKDRGGRKETVVGGREVRVAQPGRSNVKEDLAAHGAGDVNLVEVEPAADGVENEGFHGPQDARVPSASLVQRYQGVSRKRQRAANAVDIH
jgi:hypothetical protein